MSTIWTKKDEQMSKNLIYRWFKMKRSNGGYTFCFFDVYFIKKQHK